MKRHSISAIVLVLSLLTSLAGPARGAAGRWDFRLKLSAGTGRLTNGGGDLETLRRDWQDNSKEWEDNSYESSTFDWKRASCLSDLRLELLLASGRHLGFSLGLGALAFSSGGDITYTYDVTDSGWWKFTVDEDRTYNHKFKVRAIPLELNAYFFLPLGGRSSLYAYAGPGLVLGMLDHEYEYFKTIIYTEDHYYEENKDYARESELRVRVTEDARGSALGLQGGIGWELRLSSLVSVGIESSLRLANIINWRGTGRTAYESSERIYREAEGWGPTTTESATEHHEGRLWFFTAWDPFDPYAWDILSGMFIRTDEPQGWTYEDVRGAGINLSAFRICFILQFHL